MSLDESGRDAITVQSASECIISNVNVDGDIVEVQYGTDEICDNNIISNCILSGAITTVGANTISVNNITST